jgi:hypothetical protein
MRNREKWPSASATRRHRIRLIGPLRHILNGKADPALWIPTLRRIGFLRAASSSKQRLIILQVKHSILNGHEVNMGEDLVGLGKMADAIERVTREVRKLAQDLLSPVAQEAGEYIADRIRYARVTAAIRALELANGRIRLSGMAQKPVPLKILASAIEGAALEEDEYMISHWAGLIASTATTGNVLPSFVDTLGSLSTEEARLLDRIHSDTKGDPRNVIRGGELCEASGLSIDRFNVFMESIARSGLITRAAPEGGISFGPIDPWNLEQWVTITRFGAAFVRACHGPEKE